MAGLTPLKGLIKKVPDGGLNSYPFYLYAKVLPKGSI
jgi:hypothetical protein